MLKSTFNKKPLLLVLLCAAVCFVCGCVAAPVKDAEELTPKQIPSGQKAKPVQLKKALVKIKRGTVIGSWQEGMLCLPAGEITWKGGRFFFDIAELDAVFRDEFESANYTVVGEPNALFDDPSSWKAEYLIGAMVTDMDISICSSMAGLKGQVFLEVNWQVYSRLDRRVVFQTTTEGSYAIEEPASETLDDMILNAFGMATQNLLADAKFYGLVAGETQIVAAGPESFNRLVLAKCTKFKKSIEYTINDVRMGVVTVFAGEGHGSGFFIDSEGHMLTSAHVVRDAKFVKIKLVTGREILGEVLRKNPRIDIALVKAGEENMVPVPLNEHDLTIGAPVCAIGTPLDQSLSSTVTRGILSAYRAVEGNTYIQSDVDVLPGSSGCPLVDQHGNAVGISVAGAFFGGSPAGLNFFVPVNQALNALNVEMVPPADLEGKRLLAAKEAASKTPKIIDKLTEDTMAIPPVPEEKVSASLLVTCTNEKSVVEIRQGGKLKYQGKPPYYMKNISPGSYTIRVAGIDSWGYEQIYEETVHVDLGEAVTVSVKLEFLKQNVSGGIGTGKNTAEIKRSKITAGSASEKQVAAIPKIEVNKKEPWTGIWEVEASHREGGGIWGLKQGGKSVVSTQGSYYEVKGEVEGDQLKGRLKDSYGIICRFVIKISSDGQSFEGKIQREATIQVKGRRKK